MSKEMWIDCDECILWFDSKPTYEALGEPNLSAAATDSNTCKVQVPDEVYAEYQEFCLQHEKWQKYLSERFSAAAIARIKK